MGMLFKSDFSEQQNIHTLKRPKEFQLRLSRFVKQTSSQAVLSVSYLPYLRKNEKK